jgi:putative ABC transport system permease protein
MDGMFFTYIWRELRRRMRQAVLAALGLALGVGLVITVTAASDGVKDSQATVLHTLYGVGTDITVTQPPAKGSGAGPRSASGRRSRTCAAGRSPRAPRSTSTSWSTPSTAR